MKLRDKITELIGEYETDMDRFMQLSQIGSFLNLLGEGISELEDKEVSDKFHELAHVITTKREELWEKEI